LPQAGKGVWAGLHKGGCTLSIRGTKTNIFNALRDKEEAQDRALWPAFLAAKAAREVGAVPPRPTYD
jgi:hypothetical protein